MATLLALGACSSNGSDQSTTTVSSTAPASSADPTATSTSTPTIATTTTVPPSDDVVIAWTAYWDAWAEVRASDNLDPSPLAAVASAPVVDGAIALFELQRSSGLGPVETEVVLHPNVIVGSDPDQVSVEDCVLLSPSFTDTVGVWYEADLTLSGQSWIVDAVRIPRVGGCVPREMADGAIDGYDAYYTAEAEFWDPASPDSALIGAVLAEPQKSFIVGLLEEHETRGVALRGQPTTHPEIVEVRSQTELVLLSCSEPDPNYGLYNVDTGERLPDEPMVSDGQRDLQSAVMVFEGGSWKVSDFQGQVDFACEFAPTDRGLPSV